MNSGILLRVFLVLFLIFPQGELAPILPKLIQQLDKFLGKALTDDKYEPQLPVGPRQDLLSQPLEPAQGIQHFSEVDPFHNPSLGRLDLLAPLQTETNEIPIGLGSLLPSPFDL